MSIDAEADALLAEVATSTPTRLRALLVAALRRQRDAGAERMRGRQVRALKARLAEARDRLALAEIDAVLMPLTEPDDA